jgi:hypothetical protein
VTTFIVEPSPASGLRSTAVSAKPAVRRRAAANTNAIVPEIDAVREASARFWQA